MLLCMHQVAIFTHKLPLTAKACAPSPQNELQTSLDDRVTCLKFIAQVLASEAHRMTTAASADNIIPKRESINQRAETVIPDPATKKSKPATNINVIITEMKPHTAHKLIKRRI